MAMPATEYAQSASWLGTRQFWPVEYEGKWCTSFIGWSLKGKDRPCFAYFPLFFAGMRMKWLFANLDAAEEGQWSNTVKRPGPTHRVLHLLLRPLEIAETPCGTSSGLSWGELENGWEIMMQSHLGQRWSWIYSPTSGALEQEKEGLALDAFTLGVSFSSYTNLLECILLSSFYRLWTRKGKLKWPNVQLLSSTPG